jgi:hypothetical protein
MTRDEAVDLVARASEAGDLLGDAEDWLVDHVCDDDLQNLVDVAEAECDAGHTRITECAAVLCKAMMLLLPDQWDALDLD